jgi:hypothetical protein
MSSDTYELAVRQVGSLAKSTVKGEHLDLARLKWTYTLLTSQISTEITQRPYFLHIRFCDDFGASQ